MFAKRLTQMALFLTALLLVVRHLASQQDFSKVEIQTVDVAPGVHMLIGSGGNIGVSSGEDGVIVIDDQYAPLTEKITAAIAKISGKPIRFVVNTHWHGDHTGGNENLGKAGAVIVAHANVRQRMSQEHFNAFFNRRTPPSPPGALPIVTFTQDVSFHVNGDELHAFHVEPAHTDGDSIIHWKKANVFHMGDLYFSAGYPFIDLSSKGTAQGMIAAADKVIALANGESKIIPGHGPLSTRSNLIAYRNMLKDIESKVTGLINQGKSLEEVKAAKPTASYDAEWGTGFIKGEQITEFFYHSYKKTS
jgi:glyoxylase-like metal-dependent hydrolase (beta-lactamase superfamily II)